MDGCTLTSVSFADAASTVNDVTLPLGFPWMDSTSLTANTKRPSVLAVKKSGCVFPRPGQRGQPAAAVVETEGVDALARRSGVGPDVDDAIDARGGGGDETAMTSGRL